MQNNAMRLDCFQLIHESIDNFNDLFYKNDKYIYV